MTFQSLLSWIKLANLKLALTAPESVRGVSILVVMDQARQLRPVR